MFYCLERFHIYIYKTFQAVSISFCFLHQRAMDGRFSFLIGCCTDTTMMMWWLPHKAACLRNKPFGCKPNFSDGKTPSGEYSGGFPFLFLFFLIWDKQITPFSKLISILRFHFHFIRLTDSLPLQSYKTWRRDLHLGKLETITDHYECNWLIILLIKSHEH